MQRLVVEFMDQGLHRVLFDAMPMPVFVVDNDVGILEYNRAAADLLSAPKEKVLRRRGGEVLHCVHSTDVPEGCGRGPVCANCVVRDAVRSAYAGKPVTRRLTRMELVLGGKATNVNVRVSCSPFQFQQRDLALLMLEGLGG